MKGSRPLFKELFETFAKDAPEGGWHSRDVYVFTEEHLAWFESKGCTWHKVCAEPGDLILWDSVRSARFTLQLCLLLLSSICSVAAHVPLWNASKVEQLPHRNLRLLQATLPRNSRATRAEACSVL